ncbi:RraA family protein [Aspergillus brunneoviolaceus CBS 621.78]|uniref:RraA-like protein n=1 Tax=Aspergillus brunneoviolaceus CBS 621.78 TaxID=1450534 RepID=A0ACD1G212_9EURO|nr:RraA-like protein [Aspergillus brunneoviolaceus CBS 621.78]RAH43266.1 RraA-like protein [Aspergillus brunneoviolaceus CBS 621.78]
MLSTIEPGTNLDGPLRNPYYSQSLNPTLQPLPVKPEALRINLRDSSIAPDSPRIDLSHSTTITTIIHSPSQILKQRHQLPTNMPTPTPLEEKLRILHNYSACDVSDALLKLQTPAPGAPARAGHLADLISTIKFISKHDDIPAASNDNAHTIPPNTHWVDTVDPDTIVVIDQPPTQHCAVVGGIMALRMKHLGVKGAVVNGRVRDLAEFMECGLPVWARGTSTVGSGAEAKAVARNVAVDVGGVVVEPGDIIVCDPVEGVVAIPRDLLDAVLETMPKLVAMDDRVKEAVGQGVSVLDAFKRFRGKI